jgi:hypothetical protein
MADGEESHEAQIIIDQAQMGGVWANFARVSHSEHEFTLDFIRLDYATDPIQGVVVSRVSVSPLFVTQLVDAINDNWKKYAKKAMPQEVRDAEDEPNTGD